MTNQDLLSLNKDKTLHELLELARTDERETIFLQLYKLQKEVITISGIRGSYISEKDLRTILPEKKAQF